MKKQIFIFGLILLSISALAQKKNVVDYFHLLPDSLKHYPLEYKNGKWISVSDVDYEVIPVVDIQNGFIEMQPRGLGEGEEKQQVVLYREKDGSALIGVSYYYHNGTFFEKYQIFFGEYKNNKWIDVTHKVLPEINFYTFMKSGYKISNELKQYLAITYDLPQHGTTITVHFQYNEGICLYRDIKNKNKNLCDEFTKNVKYDSIKLKWDKENTRFVIQK